MASVVGKEGTGIVFRVIIGVIINKSGYNIKGITVNKKQLAIIFFVFAFITLYCLFPPWIIKYKQPGLNSAFIYQTGHAPAYKRTVNVKTSGPQFEECIDGMRMAWSLSFTILITTGLVVAVSGKKRGLTGLALTTITTVAAFIFIANYMRARMQGNPPPYAPVKIAAALELYSLDNEGIYPQTMEKLVPKYLNEIPKCPYTNEGIYEKTYETGVDCCSYTFRCSSAWKPEVVKANVKFNSLRGFIYP